MQLVTNLLWLLVVVLLAYAIWGITSSLMQSSKEKQRRKLLGKVREYDYSPDDVEGVMPFGGDIHRTETQTPFVPVTDMVKNGVMNPAAPPVMTPVLITGVGDKKPAPEPEQPAPVLSPVSFSQESPVGRTTGNDETPARKSLFAKGRTVAESVLPEPALTVKTGLKKSDERLPQMLRILVDKLPNPAWVRNRDLQILYCNTAYADALNTIPVEVTASQQELAAGLFGDDGRDLARHALASDAAQTRTQPLVIDGKRRLMEFQETPLIDGTGLVGFARDFTAEEEMQGAYDRQVSAQQYVFNALDTAIAVYGSDQRLRFHNDAFLRLWKLDEAALKDQPKLADVLESMREKRFLPEQADFSAYLAAEQQLFSRLIDPRHQLVHLPDERTLKESAIPHPLGGIVYTWQDVTDRVTLEKNYRNLDTLQKATIDNLSEAVAVFDEKNILQLCNPAFEVLWQGVGGLMRGLSVDGWLEHIRPLFLRREKEDAAAWEETREKLRTILSDRKKHHGRMTRATDETVLEYTIQPLEDGTTLCRFADVTASENVERALMERNTALEKADKVKSDFVASMSYDLRTPLNAIIGYSGMLQDGLLGKLTEKQTQTAADIGLAGSQLQALIDDMLDMASIEAGFIAIQRRATAVKPMLDEVMQQYAERFARKNIKFTLECQDNIGEASVDSRRIRQALGNLLGNALKFTSENGTVTVLAFREDNMLTLAVKDNGMGIPAGMQPRIFEKFERSGNNTRISGAGLGLALVRQYVELHRGTVALESEEGKGTTITCRLPV